MVRPGVVAMSLLQVVSLFTEAARLNPDDADLQVTLSLSRSQGTLRSSLSASFLRAVYTGHDWAVPFLHG